MDKRIYQFLEKLFDFAEKVANRFDPQPETPVAKTTPNESKASRPKIHFSNEDRMVEGELFQ
ncbi:MAG: hypothetical protein IJV17_06680 [Prevotella sp.]|nr:hypothetical protein [Prevotella sp.]